MTTTTRSFLLATIWTLMAALPAAANPILLMDTTEFKTVRHAPGKRLYVQRVTNHLKRLRIKVGDFDAMQSDQHEVFEMIESPARWKPLMSAVESACKKKENSATCSALAKTRLDTFNYIKSHPVDYESGEPVDATSSKATN